MTPMSPWCMDYLIFIWDFYQFNCLVSNLSRWLNVEAICLLQFISLLGVSVEWQQHQKTEGTHVHRDLHFGGVAYSAQCACA